LRIIKFWSLKLGLDLVLGVGLSLGLALLPFNLYSESLSDIYLLAVDSDPTYQASKMELLANKENVNQSFSRLLPQIDLNYNYSRLDSDFTDRSNSPAFTSESDTTFKSYSISLSQQIYNHSNLLNLKISEKEALRADIENQRVKQELIIRLADAYFEVLTAKDNVAFSNAQILSIKQKLITSRKQLKTQSISDYEDKEEFDYYRGELITQVYEAQQAYDRTIAEEIALEDNLQVAFEALRWISGKYHYNLSSLKNDVTLSAPNPNNVQSWVDRSNSDNLNLKASYIDLNIAKNNISVARGDQYPTVEFSVNYSQSTDSSRILDSSSPLFRSQNDFGETSIGVNFNLPLYTGGNHSSQVKQAKFLHRKSSYELETVRRNANQETRNAFSAINANLGSAKALEKALISSQESLKATELGLKQGTRDLNDVLDQTQQYYELQQELSRTKYEFILNTLRLKQAVGSLSGNDLFELNALLQ